MDIPDSGAVFTLGKSHLAENTQSYFFIKNDPVKRLTSGSNQSAVICESGRLFVWGENQFGQLGIGGGSGSGHGASNGNHSGGTNKSGSSRGNSHISNNGGSNEIVTKPTCVKSLKALGLKATDIAFGNGWCVILTNSNEIFFTGRNIFTIDKATSIPQHFNTTVKVSPADNDNNTGGSNESFSVSRKPFRLEEFDGLLEVNKKEDFIKIVAGNEHFVVLTSHGRIFGWGNNDHYQLGLQDKILPVPVEVTMDGNIKDIICGSQSTLLLNENNQLFLAGSLNDFHFPTFKELTIPTSIISPTEQITFFYISRANEIFLVTNSIQNIGTGSSGGSNRGRGSIYKSNESIRNKKLIFQKFYDYDNEENGPAMKIVKGNLFYAVLTKKNRFFTTFSESGHHLKTFREISKFKNLKILDIAVGDKHILIFGQPKTATTATATRTKISSGSLNNRNNSSKLLNKTYTTTNPSQALLKGTSMKEISKIDNKFNSKDSNYSGLQEQEEGGRGGGGADNINNSNNGDRDEKDPNGNLNNTKTTINDETTKALAQEISNDNSFIKEYNSEKIAENNGTKMKNKTPTPPLPETLPPALSQLQIEEKGERINSNKNSCNNNNVLQSNLYEGNNEKLKNESKGLVNGDVEQKDQTATAPENNNQDDNMDGIQKSGAEEKDSTTTTKRTNPLDDDSHIKLNNNNSTGHDTTTTENEMEVGKTIQEIAINKNAEGAPLDTESKKEKNKEINVEQQKFEGRKTEDDHASTSNIAEAGNEILSNINHKNGVKETLTESNKEKVEENDKILENFEMEKISHEKDQEQENGKNLKEIEENENVKLSAETDTTVSPLNTSKINEKEEIKTIDLNSNNNGKDTEKESSLSDTISTSNSNSNMNSKSADSPKIVAFIPKQDSKIPTNDSKLIRNSPIPISDKIDKKSSPQPIEHAIHSISSSTPLKAADSNTELPLPIKSPKDSNKSLKFDEKSLKSQKSQERLIRPQTPYPDSNKTGGGGGGGTPTVTTGFGKVTPIARRESFTMIAAADKSNASTLNSTTSNMVNVPEKLKPISRPSSHKYSVGGLQKVQEEDLSRKLSTELPDFDKLDEKLIVEIDTIHDADTNLDKTFVNEIRFINNGIDVTENVLHKMNEENISQIEEKLLGNDPGEELATKFGGKFYKDTTKVESVKNSRHINTADSEKSEEHKSKINNEEDERTTASVNSNISGNLSEEISDISSDRTDRAHEAKVRTDSDGPMETGKNRMQRFITDIKNKGKDMSCRNHRSTQVEDEPPIYSPVDENMDRKTSKVCTIL